MPRYKVEYELDSADLYVNIANADEVHKLIAGWQGVDAASLKVARLPDPPIVQRFMVEVTTPATETPAWPGVIQTGIERWVDDYRKVTVTEVIE